MAFCLASPGAKTANTNFLIFDVATQSQGAVIKRGFASCWKGKRVLPASRSAPPYRMEQHMSVGAGNRSKQETIHSDSLTLSCSLLGRWSISRSRFRPHHDQLK